MTNEHGLGPRCFRTSSNNAGYGVGKFGQRNGHGQFLVVGDVEPVAGNEHCVARCRQQIQKTKPFFGVEVALSNAGRVEKDVVAISATRGEGAVIETKNGNDAGRHAPQTRKRRDAHNIAPYL